jgi:DNA-binding MarR family transcriptional regulator
VTPTGGSRGVGCSVPSLRRASGTYAAGVGTEELEHQLLLLARRLAKPVRLHGPSGYTVLDRPAYQTLGRIVEDGPLRATALAKLVEVDLSVVSRQVKALEAVGFVQRQPDPHDARAALVTATEAGEQAFAITRQQRSEVLQEVLTEWTDDEREIFVRLMTRFNAELEAEIGRRQAATGQVPGGG